MVKKTQKLTHKNHRDSPRIVKKSFLIPNLIAISLVLLVVLVMAVDFPGLTKFEWYEVNGDTDSGVGSDAWRGQTFTIGTVGSSESFNVSGVSIQAKRVGTGCDNTTFQIEGTASSLPNATIFSVGWQNASKWGASSDWHNITMHPLRTLIDGQQYALVVNTTVGSDCMQWKSDNSAPAYTGGTFVDSANGLAGTWNLQAGRDFLFKIWGGELTAGTLLSIISPTNTTFLQTTMDFNISVVNGTNAIDTCWYTLDATGINNITLANDTATNFFDRNTSIAIGGYKVIFTCNDSANDIVTDNVDFEIQRFLISNQGFNAEVTEGSAETFLLNVSLEAGLQITTAVLNYNNTNFDGTFSIVANNYSISRSLTVPSVTAKTNISFNWNVTFDDDTSFVTDKQNQSVANLEMDNCTTNSILLLNYSLRDEETQNLLAETDIVNSSVEVDLDIFPVGSSVPIASFSSTYPLTNNPQVCLETDLGDSTFEMDVTTRYGANDYARELHHIQKFTLTNASLPQNIILFDLLSDDATSFLITFRDRDYILVEDALIDIRRKYVGEGTFKSVEIPKTDANGQAVASF
ncbi:hypothetical protein LCGC14_1746420, partial [marine sediment metagenome]